MYHATYADTQSLAEIDKPDQPYAVTEADFIAHMTSLREAGYAFVSEGSVLDEQLHAQPLVLLTFDDGHRSNAIFATNWLRAQNLSGLFFITTDWIDKRSHYCTADDLRSMHAAGMGIGSHGCSHRFIQDMDAVSARSELAESKSKLEDILGVAVRSISFPGGRCGPRDIEIALELGYEAVHGSQFGLHAAGDNSLIKRLPIRQGMSASTVLDLCNPSSALHRKVAIMTRVKTTVKRVVGNGVYDAIYRRLSA